MSHVEKLDIFFTMAASISFGSACEIASEPVFYIPVSVCCFEIFLPPKCIIPVVAYFIIN
jgi:hypothetical protein